MNENEVKDLIEFGKRVQELRAMRGMTLQELADKCGYTSRSTVKKIESGLVNVPTSKVKALADALGVSPLVLMGTEEMPAPDTYYLNPETAALAQRIYEDAELRALFDVAADAAPADLQAAHLFLKALKEREQQG